MLLPILLAASLLPAQQASMHCVDTGAQTATSQTQPLRGPAGVAAVLKVSTADDHDRNSHACNAEYQLLILPAAGGTPVVVDLLTTDDDYDRSLSLRLDGFSQDGKRIFGTSPKAGNIRPQCSLTTTLTNGKVQLIELTKLFLGTEWCSTTFDVIGTTETGAIALELDSANKCVPKRRSLLDPATLQPLPQGPSILPLFNFKNDAP